MSGEDCRDAKNQPVLRGGCCRRAWSFWHSVVDQRPQFCHSQRYLSGWYPRKGRMMALGTGLKPGVTRQHDVTVSDDRLVPATLGAAKGSRGAGRRHRILRQVQF